MDKAILDRLKTDLNQNGLVVFDINKEEYKLEEVAGYFGHVIPGDKGDIVQTLLAQDKGKGSYGSFTFNVGYGAFPWHTDTAYWDNPVRYL